MGYNYVLLKRRGWHHSPYGALGGTLLNWNITRVSIFFFIKQVTYKNSKIWSNLSSES